MKYFFLKLLILTTVCSASGLAFYYLNTIELKNPAESIKESSITQKKKKVVLTNRKTKRKQIIIIDPPSQSWVDSLEKKMKKKEAAELENAENKGSLPDVELLKFVIEKSREGIPVLSFRNVFDLI